MVRATPKNRLSGVFRWRVLAVNEKTGEVCLGQFGVGSRNGYARMHRVIFAEAGLTEIQAMGFTGKKTPEYVRGMDMIPFDDPDWKTYVEKPESLK